MKTFKLYSKVLLVNLAVILILSLLISIIHYTNLIGDKAVDYILFTSPILSIFFCSYFIGKNSNIKGWLNGLIYSLYYIVVSKLLQMIFYNKDLLDSNLIFILIIILTSMFGSMVGISRKVEKD